MAGLLSPTMQDYRDPSGERLGEAIDRIGGNVAALEQARREDVAAFFELHIEQGVVLENGRIDLGIVSAIVGIARVEIRYEGRADHAGTTPMDLRQDAGLAAAVTVAAVHELASARAGAGRGHFVATVGVVELAPNASNVVPGHARLVVDIRGEDHALAHEFLAALDERTGAIAATHRVQRKGWAILSDTSPVACDPHLRSLLVEAAGDLGFSTVGMASGAGHDTAFMARIAPSAMVFVPCREGRSHAPEEWAEPDAIAAGAAAIHGAILRFDAGKR
jgi:N-carbamoyl-L-amino-acid hydrolase